MTSVLTKRRMLQIRCTDAELEALKAASESLGLPVSRFVRDAIEEKLWKTQNQTLDGVNGLRASYVVIDEAASLPATRGAVVSGLPPVNPSPTVREAFARTAAEKDLKNDYVRKAFKPDFGKKLSK